MPRTHPGISGAKDMHNEDVRAKLAFVCTPTSRHIYVVQNVINARNMRHFSGCDVLAATAVV